MHLLPQVRPECEPHAACPVRLHFRSEQWVIPLLVLHGSRKRYGRPDLKLQIDSAVVQRAALRQVIAIHLLMTILELNLVTRREPVGAPNAFPLTTPSQPTANQVPIV